MTTGEICRMLDDAYSVGMTDYVVWGGEPLLREDFPEVAEYANSLGFDVTVITNGSRLAEKVDEIAENLCGLIVSIDHPEPHEHDQLRKHPGIYQRAIEGIKGAQRYQHLNTFVNCVISKANIDQLERMAHLAEELDVKIAFEMMEVVKGYNEHLRPSNEEITRACETLVQLKRGGYPISNSCAYFMTVAERRPYSCHVPKVLVTVEWDGNIRICSTISNDAKPELATGSLGNVRAQPFSEIFRSKPYQDYVHVAERCWKCDLSYSREIALTYSLNREAIQNFITAILSHRRRRQRNV